MAVCPLGLNQICHLTIQRLITINETKDSKGNIYHTSAVLSPSESRSSPNQSADGSERAASIGSSRSSSAGSFEPGKCALAALARHGKRFVVVALRGQIWFAELTSQLSSEVHFSLLSHIYILDGIILNLYFFFGCACLNMIENLCVFLFADST